MKQKDRSGLQKLKNWEENRFSINFVRRSNSVFQNLLIMKTKILVVLFILLFSNLFAQNQDYAMIYIYRTGVFTAIFDYPVIFNNVIVHKMPYHNKLSYKIYSEGKLNIELAGNVKINLDIKHGKSYYIKSPNTGLSKIVTEEVGKKEFNKEIDQPHLYTRLDSNSRKKK